MDAGQRKLGVIVRPDLYARKMLWTIENRES